jgi:hypothetical protein
VEQQAQMLFHLAISGLVLAPVVHLHLSMEIAVVPWVLQSNFK